MGMFDSVIVRCPVCRAKVEFQSKAGECLLNEYAPANAPEEIADDLDGAHWRCQRCGEGVWLEKVKAPTLRVRP